MLVRDPMMQSAQPRRQPCAGCALYSEILRKDKLRMKNQFGDKFPDDVVNALARMLLPEIQKAYESAEGQAEFEKWKAEQADSQTDKHNPK